MSEVSGYQRFFAELKRRKVFRVAAVYGAVAFVILQVADILVPALHLPESFTTGIALLAILGFPIAVVLAWAFDSTPAGIQRTDAAKTGEIEAIIAQPAASRWPSGLLALVGVVALAIGGWLALSSRSAADSEARSGTAVDVSSERTAVSGDAKSGAAPARTAVAVLPFQSLTNDEESREFALGIHDDLLTQLSRIEDLRVTSRTSVMTYVDSDKPVREIAAELGVGTVVEGGVRTAGEQVRINIQLIDAATDEHLWAETYDRELTAENVFAIQGEIARAVTGALEAELSEQEVAALAELPTSSTEAWAAYHRARRLWGTMGGDTNDRLIVAEYQQAVELDPEFVAAWAGLVRAQSWLIRRGLETDTMPARSSLDRLRELAPESPAGLIAEGYYRYYALADFEGALPVVQEYRRLRPGDAEGWQTEGWVLRRVGRWEESTESQRHAAELDPLNAVVLWNLAVNTGACAGTVKRRVCWRTRPGLHRKTRCSGCTGSRTRSSVEGIWSHRAASPHCSPIHLRRPRRLPPSTGWPCSPGTTMRPHPPCGGANRGKLFAFRRQATRLSKNREPCCCPLPHDWKETTRPPGHGRIPLFRKRGPRSSPGRFPREATGSRWQPSPDPSSPSVSHYGENRVTPGRRWNWPRRLPRSTGWVGTTWTGSASSTSDSGPGSWWVRTNRRWI